MWICEGMPARRPFGLARGCARRAHHVGAAFGAAFGNGARVHRAGARNRPAEARPLIRLWRMMRSGSPEVAAIRTYTVGKWRSISYDRCIHASI